MDLCFIVYFLVSAEVRGCPESFITSFPLARECLVILGQMSPEMSLQMVRSEVRMIAVWTSVPSLNRVSIGSPVDGGDVGLPRPYEIARALPVLKVWYTPYRTLPISICISDQQQVSLISIGMWSPVSEESRASLSRVPTALCPS